MTRHLYRWDAAFLALGAAQPALSALAAQPPLSALAQPPRGGAPSCLVMLRAPLERVVSYWYVSWWRPSHKDPVL